MKRAIAAAVLVLIATAASAQSDGAEEPEQSLLSSAGISGSIRAAYWSSSRMLDEDAHVAAWTFRLKAAPRLPGNVSVLVDTWAHATGPGSGGDVRVRTREALMKVSAGAFDIRAGQQIIAWGRADGINPTDNLTPRDNRLLLPDDEDERMGTTSAIVSYYAGGFSLSGVWLPEFRPSGFAVPVPAGVSVTRDYDRWPGDQWAAKLDKSGGSVDWSVSFFNGRDLTPTIAPSASGVLIRYEPIRVAGADVATNVGRVGVRAEAAYVDTDDRDGDDPFVRNPFLHVVAGIDRTWREYLNVNLQYVFRHVNGRLRAGIDDPRASMLAPLNQSIWSETRRNQHGGTLRVAHQWLRETLQGEVTAVVMAAPYGLLLRTRASYAVTDHVIVSGGTDVMRGDDGSTFRLLRKNSAAVAELRWDF